MCIRRPFLMITLLALALLAVAPLAAQEGSASLSTIHVNGSGSVFGTPDIAYIEIGFEIADADLNYAFDLTSSTLYAIRDAMLALDIASEDIQTRGLSLWVDERYGPTSEEPTRYYRLSNSFRLTIRDIERVATAINAGVAAGANNIYGLQYGIADTAALEQEARVRAVADARDRAESLAALVGKAVGEPISISESSGVNYGSARLEMAQADIGSGGGGGPIEAGQLSVSIAVNLTYQLVEQVAGE